MTSHDEEVEPLSIRQLNISSKVHRESHGQTHSVSSLRSRENNNPLQVQSAPLLTQRIAPPRSKCSSRRPSISENDEGREQLNRLGLTVYVILFRALLPITLLCGCLFRFNFFSFIYLLFLLVSPLVEDHFTSNTRFTTSFKNDQSIKYTLVILIYSVSVIILQTAFQIYLHIYPPSDEGLGCGISSFYRYVGLEMLYPGADTLSICRIILPDVIIMFVSLATYIVQQTVSKILEETNDGSQEPLFPSRAKYIIKNHENVSEDQLLRLQGRFEIKNIILLLFTAILLGLTGICDPSLLTGIYLVAFLVFSSFWAFINGFSKKLIPQNVLRN